MSCLINPISGETSDLHAELIEVFGEEKANSIYALTLSDIFLEDFGDWVSLKDNPDSEEKSNLLKFLSPRLGTSLEPELRLNEAKNLYYFQMENGRKHYLDNNYINLSSEQKKALISNTIHYLSGDVVDREDLGNPNFNDLYQPVPENLAMSILGGQVSALKELEQEVRKFYDINTKNYSDEIGKTEEELEREDNGLGLTSSVEKNSKDNATANIKFLFSYVPKFNSDGDMVTIQVPNAITGNMMEIPQYLNYHEIWNYFEETLANIHPQLEGSTYADGFEIMMQRLRDKYGENSPYHNPSVARLIDEEVGILRNFPDFKKKQFFQAFSKTKVNFYTTTIKKDGSTMNMTFFNSGDITARYKKVASEYELGIQNGPLVDNTNGTYNQTKAQQIHDKFLSLKANVAQGKFPIGDVAEYTRVLFNQAGIGISKVTLLNHFEATKPSRKIKDPSQLANHKASVALDSIELVFEDLAKATSQSVFKDGKYNSPLTMRTVLNEIARVESEFRKDISENTLLGPDNKKYWAYSNHNYLGTKLKRIKDNVNLESSLEGFYENSVWLNYLAEETDDLSTFKNNFEVLRFLNLKLEDVSDAGVDNKNISPVDQIVDMFNKALMLRGNYDYSIINTMTPADKSQSQGFKITQLLDSGFEQKEDGTYLFSEDLKDVYKGYLKDEINRISTEFDKVMEYKQLQDNIAATKDEDEIKEYERQLDNLKERLYQYFHYDKNGNLFTEKDGKTMPAGNFFKFTLFDEFNLDHAGYEANSQRFLLYDKSEGVDVITPIMDGSKVATDVTVDRLVNQKLSKLLNDTIDRLEAQRIIEVKRTEIGKDDFRIDGINVSKLVDKDIFEYYLVKHGQNQTKAALDFIFESAINQHHANTEYSKVFSGDYAYYKNLDDYSKRVPATYTDGILPAMEPGDEPIYTMAIMPDVKVDSEYLDYVGIDATDAQGYITYNRWKFLTRRLNKYYPKLEEVFKRFEEGRAEPEDYQFAAQPLKGVYFDADRGVPTYVKYSAIPLLPNVTKSFKIDKLRKNMEEQGIDEVVALSGVKVGAVTTSEMMDENKDFVDNMKFYKQYLNNHSWKLQQDLSPKGMKQTLLGSQMQWNLTADLEDDVTYGESNKTGAEIRNSVNELISKLSNMHLDAFKEEIGLDLETGVIKNREAFYNSLLDELMKNGGDLNSLEALKREYPLDYILTNRNKFQNLISAVINNAAVKIKTNGGSFIQASSHQWELQDGIDETQLDTGITLLVDKKDLKKLRPPVKEGDRVLPGQVFISHQEISKYIPNYKQLAKEGKLKDMIDDRLRYIVGYRIPNQDLASNDALEIVGILPDSMGDTVLPYIDITTKTGSDFDIDKMYLFLPNMKPVYTNRGEMVSDMIQMETQEVVNILMEAGWTQQQLVTVTSGKNKPDAKHRELVELAIDEGLYTGDLSNIERLEYFEDKKNTETIKGVENKLLEEFINILTAKELHSTLVQSIDNDEIKDHLKKLHKVEEDKIEPFTFFSPLYQVEKKFDNSAGKAGTGIISNHKVDHSKTQAAKVSMNENLGVGIYENGATAFYGIYDSRGKKDGMRINEALSLFITANVDIAKDPWITKGNYTPVSFNTGMMLIRAGTPYQWVTGFLGQPIIEKLVELEAIKDSRTNPIKKNVTRLLEDEIWTSVQELRQGPDFQSYKKNKIKGIEGVINSGDAIREGDKFKQKYLEKHIEKGIPSKLDEKITYHLDQLMYLKLYDRYNKIANKFNSTVVNSKADVNGAKSNFMSNFNYINKYNQMFDFKSETEFTAKGNKKPLFNNLKAKFDSFLGTKHTNSVELVDKIFKNELITATNKAKSIYNSYINVKPFATEEELVKLESSLFGFIASKNNFLNLEGEQLRELFTTNKLHKQAQELKLKYPDNTMLQYLEFDKVEGLYLLKMDNFKNKPNTLKDDLIKGWQQLHENETNFSESLIKYSFATSNFQFNSNAFFEFIPYNITKDIVGDTVEYYRNKNLDEDEFFSFLFRHNPDLAPEVDGPYDFATDSIILPVLNRKLYGNELIVSEKNAPYLKRTLDSGKVELYERVVDIPQAYDNYDIGAEDRIYIRKNTLGYKKSGYTIYEHNLGTTSIFKNNNVDRSKDIIPNLTKFIENIGYHHVANNPTTTVSDYYLQPKEINSEQLNNINNNLSKANKSEITLEEFNELTRTQQEYLVNCFGF